MATLTRDLRRDLERTVKQARRVAEAGARKILEELGVHHHEPYGSMTPEQRALRNRLRAHGRQMGDRRDRQKGSQTIDRLIQECSYEHWHRMLFARFLAETDLLIEPRSRVAITLEECQEQAREKGVDWLELASGYAERMLPQIFRLDDPALAATLPPETRSDLEDLLESLPCDVFTADDSLGWVYQFWQAEKKDEVNRSEAKIGADELPSVTQLFTEDYMVLFLLHNTLGAWWAGKVLANHSTLASSARSEDDLRSACGVGGIEWTYLRFVREADEAGVGGPWRPAAGTFKGWPRAAKDLTVLDPCMGSGHFLVFALPILVALRKAEEDLSGTDAADAVLRDNLFGLEIDLRCTQIAAFNLAFAAWRRTEFHQLPPLNLACSGLAIGVTKAEWLKLAEKAAAAADQETKRDFLGVEGNSLTHGFEERIKNGLESLYDLFAKAPWLGSLIDPRRAGGDIFRESFAKLDPLLTSITTAADTHEAREMAVAARGMAHAAKLLGGNFTLTITNVPYLTRQAQSDQIRQYCGEHFDKGKADLATCFISRALSWAKNGTISVVAPTGWHYQPAYTRFRKHLLDTCEWNSVLRLGSGAFEGISGEVVNVSLCTVTHIERSRAKGSVGFWIDGSEAKSPIQKGALASSSDLHPFDRLKQKSHPDHRIILAELGDSPALAKYARSLTGTRTADNPQFLRNFWELEAIGADWEPLQSTVKTTVPFGGREQVIHWEKGEGKLRALADLGYASIQGAGAWGKQGICVSLMGNLPTTLYTGEKYDMNCGIVWTDNEKEFPALWAYLSSEEYSVDIRKIDQQLKLTTATLLKIPFDIHKWRAVAATKFATGLPTPNSSNPNQWIYSGHPKGSTSPLAASVSRLIGYRWPRQTGSSFMDCPSIQLDGLENHADDDGIVCLTALKGEAPVEQRLNALLSVAFGGDWSATKLAGLLSKVGFTGKSLDDWLRDGFFGTTLRTVRATSLCLAHLGWSARRLPRPRQLPPPRCS